MGKTYIVSKEEKAGLGWGISICISKRIDQEGWGFIGD